MIIFHSIAEALRAGYMIEEPTADGYVARTRTKTGWARALVVFPR